MIYINNRIQSNIYVQKSEFIAIGFPIDNTDKIESILNDLKKEFPKANHYCYACIIDNFIRFSDDGEPSSTAGKPILNVLQNKKLNHIILFVIRYFGGIKLGAGNLLRTYVNATIKCLENVDFYEKKELDKVKITIAYNYFDKLLYLFEKEKFMVLQKDFSEDITVIAAKENIDIQELRNTFNGNLAIEFLEKINILVHI